MKKLLTLFAFAVISIAASAQSWVGSGIGFGYNGFNGFFSINPEYGYSFNNKMAVVGNLDYEYNGGSVLKVGPYFRYNFVKLGNFKIFGEAGVQYMYAGGSGVYVALRPGATYDLKGPWSLYGNMTLFDYSSLGDVVTFSVTTKFQLGVAYRF